MYKHNAQHVISIIHFKFLFLYLSLLLLLNFKFFICIYTCTNLIIFHTFSYIRNIIYIYIHDTHNTHCALCNTVNSSFSKEKHILHHLIYLLVIAYVIWNSLT